VRFAFHGRGLRGKLISMIRIIIVLLVFASAFVGDYSHAEDSSDPTQAKIWGFVPLNGAGLVYTGHPVAGGILLGLEGLTLVVFVASAVTNCNDSGDPGDCRGMRNFTLLVGGGLFGLTYLLDAFSICSVTGSH